MKQVEVLARWENMDDYQIDRITDGKEITVVFRNVKKHPNGVIAVFHYHDVGRTCSPKWMNWCNIIRCSNYYGVCPEECLWDGTPGYMSFAVQKGLKPAATYRFPYDDQRVQKLKEELPDNCIILPYREEDTTFICQKGKLTDFYDLDEVKEIYALHGIYEPNWTEIRQYCDHELSFFADNTASGISIERGANGINQTIVVGLLLGYPIESTIAYSKRNYKLYSPKYPVREIKKYFDGEDGSFGENKWTRWIKEGNVVIDPLKNRWLREENAVFLDGQQESLYYDF